ncbi:MAG TPA: alpha/beta hydrolase [Candidatus Sumerlaeota bacterium]|nr:alpha/beta hydrolase [Candidatus Sumerlaeota bacterium]
MNMRPLSRQVRKVLVRIMLVIFLSLSGFILAFAGFLFFHQRRMIYFPRRYAPEEERALPQQLEMLTFPASSGVQTAYYLPPANGSLPPEQLWVLFGGNASLALDWFSWLEGLQGLTRQGMLLVEYPGYGHSEGKPTLASIAENTEGAFQALAQHLGVESADLEDDLNVLGHSLGAATALQFASGHPVRRVILLAPFTSLLDMARHTVHWPLHHMLKDRFDNMARLAELASREQPPVVHILHGESDQIIPFEMGRRLADSQPSVTVFHPSAGTDHNDILDYALPVMIKSLSESTSTQEGEDHGASEK